MTFSVIDLSSPAGLRLHDGGAIDVEVPPRRSGEQDGWVVARYHAETNEDVHADHWEIHPAGQEVVSVLSGQARVMLRPAEEGGPEETVTLTPGTACIVPRNRWHRLEVAGPTDLQVITPRRDTRLEARQ